MVEAAPGPFLVSSVQQWTKLGLVPSHACGSEMPSAPASAGNVLLPSTWVSLDLTSRCCSEMGFARGCNEQLDPAPETAVGSVAVSSQLGELVPARLRDLRSRFVLVVDASQQEFLVCAVLP